MQSLIFLINPKRMFRLYILLFIILSLDFLYVVECKWAASKDVILDGMKLLVKFQTFSQHEKGEKDGNVRLKGVLISNFRFTKALKAEAQKLKIKLVQIQDILK